MAAILTRDKDGVMANFELQGAPMFAIYEGSKPLTCCCEGEEEDRRKKLSQYLDFMVQSGSTTNFDIRYYDECGKNGKVTNATPFFASLPFKVNDTAQAQEMLSIKSGNGAVSMNNDLMFKLFDAKLENIKLMFDHQLQEKEKLIRDLEEALAAEPDEEEEMVGSLGIVDQIGAIGDKHPWMQNIIKDLSSTINNLVNGAKTKFTAMTEKPVQMAGLPPKPEGSKSLDELLKWSQRSLIETYRQKHGVVYGEDGKPTPATMEAMNKADAEYVNDMVKLAEVAATKPNTFENAIKSLREL